jgi:hypothetical protein
MIGVGLGVDVGAAGGAGGAGEQAASTTIAASQRRRVAEPFLTWSPRVHVPLA